MKECTMCALTSEEFNTCIFDDCPNVTITTMESYNDKMKKFEKQILFLENMYGISREDFETALTPLHYLEAMEKCAQQLYCTHEITYFDVCVACGYKAINNENL